MILTDRQKRTKAHIPAFMITAGLIFCLLVQLTGCSSDSSPPPPAQKHEKVFDLEATKVANKAPMLNPVSDQIAYVGVPISITLSALDSMGDILLYDISEVNLPDEDKKPGELPNVTKTDNPSTRTFIWAWTPSQAGDYYFKASVADDGNPIMRDSEIFRIRVCELAVANEPLDLKFYFDDQDPNKPANFSPTVIAATKSSKVPVTGLGNSNFEFIDNGYLMTEGEKDETKLWMFPATTDVLLLLDLSGSTNSVYTEMKAGAKKFVDYVLTTRQNIAVYCYAGRDNEEDLIKKMSGFIGAQQNKRNIQAIRNQLYGAINALDNEIQTGDSSDLYGAVIKGIEALDKQSKNSSTKIGTLVVFSDGRDSAERYTFEKAMEHVNARPQKMYHNVITIGVNISATDTNRKGRLLVDEQSAIGKDGFFRAETKVDLIKRFTEAAFAVRSATLRSYVLAFCLPYRADNRTLAATVTDNVGNITRSSEKVTVTYSADEFEDGCDDKVDEEKVKYYDFDGDGHYSVAGNVKLHDCNDFDPYNWTQCNITDKDNDGFCGSGCDINPDCQDDPDKEPNADLINPDMTDTTIDEFDQNCDGYDGKR